MDDVLRSSINSQASEASSVASFRLSRLEANQRDAKASELDDSRPKPSLSIASTSYSFDAVNADLLVRMANLEGVVASLTEKLTEMAQGSRPASAASGDSRLSGHIEAARWQALQEMMQEEERARSRLSTKLEDIFNSLPTCAASAMATANSHPPQADLVKKPTPTLAGSPVQADVLEYKECAAFTEAFALLAGQLRSEMQKWNEELESRLWTKCLKISANKDVSSRSSLHKSDSMDPQPRLPLRAVTQELPRVVSPSAHKAMASPRKPACPTHSQQLKERKDLQSDWGVNLPGTPPSMNRELPKAPRVHAMDWGVNPPGTPPAMNHELPKTPRVQAMTSPRKPVRIFSGSHYDEGCLQGNPPGTPPSAKIAPRPQLAPYSSRPGSSSGTPVPPQQDVPSFRRQQYSLIVGA